ncbi:MAG TPA: 4Fe-4S dicluster domain-containing protein [Methanothermococcus okinawensis]|uniref:4Fe-4S dicluster domain-containing protein n=1 Tax=Methanothermococcus okinawensis TaxID=155863 RepID=A0A833E6H2_9EURY|nr:4Fe-4S dicluster domain-containing protein [Methanothermococcus okinawensis]HIP91674.1 4Fe-4S dicluster domain-containing protein [Methanothermococcus okinawensis]
MIITDVFKCILDERCTGGSDKDTPLCAQVCPTGAVVIIGNKSYSCITCGTCARECPNKAIRRNKFGGYYVDRRRCNGCGTCEILCPIGIIKIVREEKVVNNRRKIVAYPRGICVMCGLCVEVCPHGARRFFHSKDLKDRKNRALLDRYIQILERIGKREKLIKGELKPKRVLNFRTSLYIHRDLCRGCGRCIYLCPRESILEGDDVEGCSRCNICGEVCPRDAIVEGIVDEERCVLCENCIKRCPREALKIENFKVVKVKEDRETIPKRYCINCGLCADSCPRGALKVKNGSILYDRSICNLCGTCVEVCPQDVRIKRDGRITGACALCGICIEECPENAITVKKIEKFQVIRDERCITCGTCGEVCPVDAITVKVKLGSGDIGEILFNEHCVMCEKCAIHCPRDVIPNTTGYKKVVDRENSYIWTDFDLCIRCGLCNRICPVDAIDMGEIDEERCEYCSACVNICPTNAISIYRTWVEKD